MVEVRPYMRYFPMPSQSRARPVQYFSETPTDTMMWFRLRQLADVPERGMELFKGTLAEKRSRYRHFRAFVRQAEVYWNAASATRGSAAALPYYYAILQLAKAELLQTFPEKVEGKQIHHGLVHLNANGTKIRGDRVRWRSGVFSLLYEARTGSALPREIRPKAMALLSLIPEIGLEMERMRPIRQGSKPGYHSILMDSTAAWSLVMLPTNAFVQTEPVMRRLLRAYERVDGPVAWRNFFALSARMRGGGGLTLQSKATHTFRGVPDMGSAAEELVTLMGHHVAAPTVLRADFVLVPTLMKSSDFVLPLPLIRYALMFYLSSLVRYHPTKLDPVTEGAQAYLMDSVVNELPIYLLASALDGITRRSWYYEPDQYRI